MKVGLSCPHRTKCPICEKAYSLSAPFVPRKGHPPFVECPLHSSKSRYQNQRGAVESGSKRSPRITNLKRKTGGFPNPKSKTGELPNPKSKTGEFPKSHISFWGRRLDCNTES